MSTLPPLDDILKQLKHGDQSFPLVGKLEQGFDAIGLMKPSWSPIGRAAIGFGLGAGIMYSLNGLHMAPFAFDEYGQPRPFKLLDPRNGEATYFHWAVPAALLAVVCGSVI